MLSSKFIRKCITILKNKKLLLTILTVACLLLLIFYSLSGILVTLMHSTVNKVSEKTGWNVGKTLYDFESAVNIFRPKKDLWTGDLPIFQFKLSENDIKHFDELSEKSVQQGYLDKEGNTWRSIKLKYKDKTYDAEIQLRGDLQNHWATALKSYDVKLPENETINNLRKFSLVIFEDRFLRRRVANMLSKEFGMFTARDDFVVLKINGVPQGLYYIVEKIDKNFLEMQQCSSCVLISAKDSKFRDHPRIEEEQHSPYGVDYIQSRHMSPFNYELSHVDLVKSDLDPNQKKVLNSINGLFQAVEDEDIPKVVSYFDIDYLTSSEAQRMILGRGQIIGDNLKMVYKATNGKFYRIGFEGGEGLLTVEKGGLERGLNTLLLPEGKEEVKLFALLNRDDNVRQLKYKKAYSYITNDGDKFLKEVNDLVDKYLPYANAHKGSILGTKVIETEVKKYGPLFKHNMDIIKEILEYAKCYINVVEKENKVTLEIIPDSISQLKFDSFEINLLPSNEYSGVVNLEYKDENGMVVAKSTSVEKKAGYIDLTDVVKDFYFSTGLDEDLGTKKRSYTIDLTFQNTDKILVDNVTVKVKNDVTDKLLGYNEVYLEIADANDDYRPLMFSSLNDFMEMYKEFNWNYQNGVLTLLKGTYTLNRDVIIPKGIVLDIEPGVQILIDQDKSVVSYSPINIKGTEAEPVVVKALDPNKPFGVFAVVGEKGFKTNIDWLKLSDGNEKFINGLYLSGQLSLYHTDVDIRNSILSGSHSDDGINIKYGKITVDNCLFTNNFGDQFDGDYVEGVVKNSRFIEEDPNADDNGDGLDFSGSRVIVKNNLFKGFKDKGLSIGEETKPIVVYDNTFESSNLGAAVKDSSYVFFIKNKFKNNNVAVSAYQKKEIYSGGGDVYSYENEFESNTEIYKLDGKSSQKDLVFDEAVYTNIIGSIINEDLESLFQTLDPYVKNDRRR